jgi:protease IV
MAKFLIGVATGVVLVILTVILLFIAALRFREKPPQIADNSVLVLRLEGDIPEKPPVELPAFLSRGPGVTIANVWMALRKAAADPHIKAVVLEPENLRIGWAKSEELRADLDQFRKSGKPVYAYLRTPGMHDYYVALGADKIFTGPADQLYIKGLRAEIMYFKKTLDKLGVSVEIEHAGKYKDFGDMFTRPDMSPETREVIDAVVDGIYGNIVARTAAARKKSPDEVRALIDQGPYTASQALKAGLVDELRFEDEMYGELKTALKSGDPKKVGIETYSKVPASSVGLGGRSRIALIVGQGDIVRGSSDDDGTEDNLTSYGFDKMLRQVEADSGIKGVIVRIDSPGGEVNASDEMWRQMNLLSKKKPVVISMSDVAASGGYYMAMTGDPIIAYPETETGSIGVVFGKPNLHGLYDKLGVTKDSVQRGRHADIDSDYSSLTPEERDLLRKGIDESYRDFVTKVAAARHRTFDQIEPVSQGRVWLGTDAQKNSLVDQLGGLDAAVQLIKRKAHIADTENVNIDVYPQSRTIFDILTKKSQPDAIDAQLKQAFGSVPYRAWIQGGYLRLMPYWPVIR